LLISGCFEVFLFALAFCSFIMLCQSVDFLYRP
jgi:hypothetical protein